MSDLAYHRQLQKGLDAVTRIASLINEGRVSLARIDEELEQKRAIKSTIERKEREFEELKATRQDLLARLSETIALKKGELDIILASIRQLELEMVGKKNIITAASNSATEMLNVKERSKAEMRLYEKLKQQKLAEYDEASLDLNKILVAMNAEQQKLDDIMALSVTKERTLEQRERDIDARESADVVRKMHLETFEKRLKRYAEQLNIIL